jgi:hypothetical protein
MRFMTDLQATTSMARVHLSEQPREHAVTCRVCLAPTWNTNAICDDCTEVVERHEEARTA